MKKFTSVLFMMMCTIVAACSSTVGDTDGQPDSAVPDTTPVDTGVPDTATADTTPVDTASPDSVRPDTTPADVPVADVPVTDTPVAPTCDESIRIETLPTENRILIGGEETWRVLATYRVTLPAGTRLSNDRARIAATGEAANFERIGVWYQGALVAFAVPSAGTNPSTDIEYGSTPITFTGGAQLISVVARMRAVAPRSSGLVAPVSGNVVMLQLASNDTVAGWGAEYAHGLNVHLTDATTGEVRYACPLDPALPLDHSFVVRKSFPVVTPQALPTTTLSNGSDMSLYRWQIGANGDAVGVNGHLFHYELHCQPSSTLTFSRFRMRRGSVDMPLEDVLIQTSYGALTTARDLRTGSIGCIDGWSYISITFVNEETVAGSGNVYTLHATVTGSVSGDSASFFFAVWGSNPITGFLSVDQFPLGRRTIPGQMVELERPGSGIVFGGAIVWSDLSELPHSYTPGVSEDWTDEAFVENLTTINVLTR